MAKPPKVYSQYKEAPMSSPSVVSELDAALQAIQSLKPPGVSGTKISAITALCNANVQVFPQTLILGPM